MINILRRFQLINPKYFQLFPLIIGLATIFLTILIFCVPTILEFDEQDAVLSSTTMKSISSEPFRYILCVSLGMLVPFSTDHLFMLPSLLKFDILLRMESYMLPIIITIMQSFNIYFLSHVTTGKAKYFWVYYMGTYIQFIVLYNAVLAIQANLAQKSIDVSIAIIISSVATNIGIILKICFLVQQLRYHTWQQYSWVILFGIATICNLYIARSWLLKYQVSQKTGLKSQPDIYAFCKIPTLTFFLIAYNVEYLLVVDRTSEAQLLNNHNEHVIAVQGLLMGFFFLISEISYRRTKDMAKMSMAALETKRNFVRYVSHEIRTPLNTAILGLQLLEKEINSKLFTSTVREPSNTQRMAEKADKKLKSLLVELVADTHQACNVSVEILNDLLMYEKIDGGLLVLDASEVLVMPFVKEALQMFVVQAKALSLDLILKTEITNDIFVTIDSYKISQVIRNLVSNAMKFSKVDGKVTVSIEIINKLKRFRPSKSPMGSPSKDNNENSILRRFISNETSKLFPSQQSPSKRLDNDEGLVENILERSLGIRSSSNGGDIEQQSPPHHLAAERNTMSSVSSSLPGSPAKRKGSILQQFFPTSSTSSKTIFPMLSKQNLNQANNCDDNNSFHTDVIRISVHDEGAGISKVNQKRLFNEIVQFDAAKLQQGKGSGIGLWISNKIVKLHGGNIGVYSEGEGNGSLFYIDIPIARVRQRRVQPCDLYHQDLARGISLVHHNHPDDELDELDPSKAGDVGSVGGGSMGGGWFLHREMSNLSSATGGNGIGDGHLVKRQHQHHSTTSSFIAKIAHNVFGNSSSSSNSALDRIGAYHGSPQVGKGLQKQRSYLNRKSSKVGVVDEHGGSGDDAESPPPPSRPATLSPSSPKPSYIPARTKHPTSLLIVDDSAVNRKMLKRSLMDVVDCIDEAKNGKDCLEQMQRAVAQYDKGYDIIITDYFMPEMNGLEAVQIMRKELGYTGKIIGLTGNTESTMIEAFKQAGANVVLTKPFQGSELTQLIQEMLEVITAKEQAIVQSNMNNGHHFLLPSSKELSFSDMP